MNDKFLVFRQATANALLKEPGTTSIELRAAVVSGNAPPPLFDLVRKIRFRAHALIDRDLDALRSSFSEDELFEIIVAAAFGAAVEQLASAHRALEDA